MHWTALVGCSISIKQTKRDSIKPWIASNNVQISNSCSLQNPRIPQWTGRNSLPIMRHSPVDMVINCDGSYSSSASGAALIAKSRKCARGKRRNKNTAMRSNIQFQYENSLQQLKHS